MDVDLNKVGFLKANKKENKKQTSTNTDIVAELKKALMLKEVTLSKRAIYDCCSWIESNNLWVKDKSGDLINTHSYKRRKLVTVDLGAAFLGSEAAFSHPAVVLYEERDWVLIAPITSKKFGKGLDILVDIPKGSCDGLTENSTIQCDHIRAISKRRVTGTLPGTLPTEYMDKINQVVLKKFVPHINRSYNQLILENKKLISDYNELLIEKEVLKTRLKEYEKIK